MTGELVLREMTWRDIPALAALEPVLFADDAWSEQTWWAELAGRPRRCHVVGEQRGAVVGAATFLAQQMFDNPIEKMFSYAYRVTGAWPDPVVTRVGANEVSALPPLTTESSPR